MNTFPSAHATLNAIKTSSGVPRLFYGLLFAAGIFFSGATIFTILQTVKVTATVNGLPPFVYIFSALYIATQMILAHGLLTHARWLFMILTIHSVALLITAGVILPLLNWDDAVRSSLIAGTPFIILAALTLWFRNLLRPSSHTLIISGIYTVLLLTSLYLNVMIRL